METTVIPDHTPRHNHGDAGRLAVDAQHLVESLRDAKAVKLVFGNHSEVSLPEPAFEVLIKVLKQLAKGKKVSVVPVDAEITTQQAADLLVVSRPFLIGLLDAGRIPYRKVGTKRRLLAADVLAYKAKEDKRRDTCLDELAAEAQRLGLY